VDADTRLSHTMAVRRVSVSIAHELRLNEELTAAMSLCHDVAHCPYGHLGEKTLNTYLRELGLRDYDHVDVAPFLLYNLFGLDLTCEVLEGITWHSYSSGVMQANVPSEYRVVAVSDKIAYLLGDAWDATRLRNSVLRNKHTQLSEEEMPGLVSEIELLHGKLGGNYRERLDSVVEAIARESLEVGEVSFSSSSEAATLSNLRDTLFESLYSNTDLPEDIARLHRVLDKLVRSGIKANPYLLFALLTDYELYALDCLSEGRPITQEHIAQLQVGEFGLPSREDFSFLSSRFVRGST